MNKINVCFSVLQNKVSVSILLRHLHERVRVSLGALLIKPKKKILCKLLLIICTLPHDDNDDDWHIFINDDHLHHRKLQLINN